MRRLFYRGLLQDEIDIAGTDAHHLMHVMRAKAGQELVVVDDRGQVARMEMVSFAADKVHLRIVERLEADTESPLDMVIVPCLLKADKMDFVVQKAVELGAVGVVPLRSRNCVVQYDEKKAKARQERWQKIADEAAKQCGRTARLNVERIMDLQEFLSRQGEKADGLLLFCYENETRRGLKACLQEVNPARVLVLIGPEGGFSLEEAQAIESAGGQSVTLGPRILRAETAAVAAMSAVQYECGDLGTVP